MNKSCYLAILLLFALSGLLTGQTIHQVEAGPGAVSSAYSAAQPGDILELVTDGGLYDEPARLTIDKPITIRAAAGLANKPVWTSSEANYAIKLSARLTLKGIVFDGARSGGVILGAIDFRLFAGSVFIVDCDFINMSKSSGGTDGKALYLTSAAHLDTLVVNNCTFQKIGKNGIVAEANATVPGAVGFLLIENSTFWQIGAEAVYIDDPDDNLATAGPLVVINHSTFHDTKRILTHKSDYNVIRNTIFSNTASVGNDSYYIYGDSSYVRNSIYYNAGINMHTGKAINMLTVDPMYKDAANGDFSLDPNSPAVNFGDDGKSIGDVRWWPKQENSVQITAGRDKISAALAAAMPGDVIELVSDGGLYQESATLVINKNITIQAASGLFSKPIWTSDDGGYLIRTKAGLKLTGIILDGAKGALQGAGGIATDSSGYSIILTNCDFINFLGASGSNGHAIYDGLYKSQVDTLMITNSTFKNIQRQGIYFGGHTAADIGTVKYFHVLNSTFAKITDDAIYIRDHDGVDSTPGPVFIVDHCTLYDAFASYGVLAHHIDGAIIKNSIAMSSVIKGTAYYIYGDNSIAKNSLYFNTGINLHTSKGENLINLDPLFVDAEAGNFMLYKNSPAINAGDDGTTIGDPRWGVSSQVSNQLVMVKNAYSMTPSVNSVRIVWQTMESASPASVVQYGLTADLGTSLTGPDGWLIPGEGYMHEVTVTGLQPSTQYYYRVGDGVNFSADINMTKTAPQRGTAFRLMSLSDIHENNDEIWQGIAKRALKDTIDMTVFVGDFVDDGSLRDAWNSGFFIPGEPLMSQSPVIATVGNHETAFGVSVYYDYFSLPTHPENGETPEAYYSMEYGDAKIIAINSTGNYSPAFDTGSAQLTWLEQELATADTKWIFIFSHTNVISTSYHAQWSADEKAYLMPLYEKYAAQGRHILVFAGDEHNFEHLYRGGVNYIRPGCANGSLRNTDLNLVDKPYSLYFAKTNGYSTIDVSDNGDLVTLNARDTTGTIFYSTSFSTSSTPPPSIFLAEPDGYDDTTSDFYRIQWIDADPDDDAKISLYYTSELTSPGEMIAENISEDDSVNFYDWNVANIAPGAYYIYAIIADAQNPPVKRFSRGKITVIADVVAPPPVTELAGTLLSRTKLQLAWKNPTHLVHVEKPIATFETGTEGFVGENDGTATGSLEIVPGYAGNGNAMRINYQITVAWDQFAGVISFPELPNLSTTPFLDFWYRGDGSDRSLRLIVQQDNDRNAINDDWWYTESQNLTSTEWQHAIFDLRTLSALTWHPNMERTFDLENIARLDFIVPSSNAGSGFIEIDQIKLTGEISPAPDFQGVIVVRRSDRFPQSISDGDVVYQGSAETCIDSSAVLNQDHYYAAFAFDEIPNYSELGTSSRWRYSLPTGISAEDIGLTPIKYELGQNYPNPFNPQTTITYAIPRSGKVRLSVFNSLGQEMAVLVDQTLQAGRYTASFNATSLPGGVYFYRIEAEKFNSVRKMILLK